MSSIRTVLRWIDEELESRYERVLLAARPRPGERLGFRCKGHWVKLIVEEVEHWGVDFHDTNGVPVLNIWASLDKSDAARTQT